MSSQKRTEIRGDRKSELLGTLVGWLIRGLAATCRHEIEDRCGITRHDEFTGPIIFAMWHNRIVIVPPIWRNTMAGVRKTYVLTSASKDGAILANAMAVFGVGAIRGSSSRRGAAALVGMRRALKDGCDICVTPDGPRGPRYQVHPGIIKLAESAGVAIVPLHANPQSFWRLKTWDGLLIPKPFSRIQFVFDHLFVVPPGLDEAAFEAEVARLGAVLAAGTIDP